MRRATRKSAMKTCALATAIFFGDVASLQAQTPAQNGEDLFQACAVCHSIDKGGQAGTGPNLWGVYGAKAGAKAGYDYSPALKESGLTWDAATLDKWLAGPTDLVAETTMVSPGITAQADRTALIAYLKAHGG